MEDIWLQLFSAIILAIVSAVSYQFQKFTGVKVQEKHQRALHEALYSGAYAAYYEDPHAGLELIRTKMLDHARMSVPDAFKALNPVTSVLRNLSNRKAAEARRDLGLLGTSSVARKVEALR